VKKRTCGTCGYFQESDITGCGWCIHPQRRVTTDLKIMVRRGELACRDGWSRDLWAPAGELTSTPSPQPLLTEPVTPVSARYVTLESTSKSQPSEPVDVVVGETPALPMDEDRATLLSHDPRAAIEAARKRHLANLQSASDDDASESQTSLNRSGDYAGSRSPFVTSPTSDQTAPQVDIPPRPVMPRYAPEVAPVSRAEVARDGAGLVSFKSDEEQFSSVPEVANDVPMPRRENSKLISTVAGVSFEHDVEFAPTRVRTARQWKAQRDEQEIDVSTFATELVGEPEMALEPVVTETEFAEEWYADAGEAEYEPKPNYEPAPQRRRWQPNFRFERPSRQRVYEEPVETWEDDYEFVEDRVVEPEPFEPEFLPTDPAFDWRENDDRIDMTIEASPTVPRMCRTCRDFRPADNGGRGWCTNKSAFSHRRMVDADELPCETSLGCWWLPHDEVWLSEADAVAHTEPTPLVDHWLGRRERVSAASGTRRR
jgi:hypothetical protein